MLASPDMTCDRSRSDSHRLDAFVDAAFAFAVSLLIVAGGDLPDSLPAMYQALGRIPAFAMAFALITMFWLGHRSFGRLVPARDGVIVAISLAIVFTTLIYVVPLRMLTDATAHFVSGGRLPGAGMIFSFDELGQVYTVYGAGFSVLAGLYFLLNWHAERHADRLGVADKDRSDLRYSIGVWAVIAMSGLISAVLALTFPLSLFPGLPGFAYWLIPIGIGLLSWRQRKATASKSGSDEA